MFSHELLVAWAIGLIAAFIARAIDKRSINAYFDRIHTGASHEWAISLREDRGRHALTIAR